ncbi:LysR substrate-binding domain-containing protein [Pseudomonas sp. ANT_H12B]|uniref:LysR substrate-binding domain-containing protein n=1 Tax=Pseudomonas sp. ANT_H12B TaxID=2597348 RepID=UPI0011ED5796|nr:LysR substrate-binding domain-containing protein [Pseudomonas sp. ANT_H12B]KAA0980416.1 LysR family transcriptional regulator [Pseudomonas sp. ANT_H12B]
MRNLPNFASLRAFESAARLESFAAAADELHLTPSAISHQIRNLETGLGVTLFVRHTRRVELTANGQQLARKLSVALDALEEACSEWMHVPETMNLSVHCSPSFASKWLAPRLSLFMSLPNPINIRLTSSATPPDLIRHEEVDVALTYGAPIERPGILYEALGQEIIAPLASPSLIASNVPHTEKEIARYPLIDSQLSPVSWGDWFTHRGIQRELQYSGPSFDRAAMALGAAADGLGIALESTRLAQEELNSGKLFVIEGFEPYLRREMHFLCYRAAQKRSQKVERFKAWLISQLAQT